MDGCASRVPLAAAADWPRPTDRDTVSPVPGVFVSTLPERKSSILTPTSARDACEFRTNRPSLRCLAIAAELRALRGSAARASGVRVVRIVAACTSLWFAGACTGGPHPLPPGMDAWRSPLHSNNGSQPVLSVPMAGAAGAFAAAAPATMLTPSAAGAAGASTGAAGATAAAAGTTPSLPTPPPSAAGAGGEPTDASTPSGPALDDACQSQGVLLRADDAALDNVLFVMDRSSDMALTFDAQPRWQLSGEALIAALTPLASSKLRVGAIFYPSASVGASCGAPAFRCAPELNMNVSSTSCAVNEMTASDQLDFQPSASALQTLNDMPALYRSVTSNGVPLSESMQRAGSALAAADLSGRSALVLLASAPASCHWDATQTAALLRAWATQGLITHLIALPGGDAASMSQLTALSEATGQRVVAPANENALRSDLQSILLGTNSSCNLTLDPPLAPASVTDTQLIVGVQGVEQSMPRSDASGHALWSISADGSQLALLGALCTAAHSGDYDSLRITVSCHDYPPAVIPASTSTP
jgi:hypothetical protein